MRKTCALLCVSFLFLAVSVMGGQEREKALTNVDVVKLVKAGIPADTILLALQQDKTNFDTSPDALILLSKSGVQKAIIDAMLASAITPSPPVTSQQNLNDDFAKAGLKALRAIEGSLGMANVENGQVTVPRAIQELIDNTDAEARTDNETGLVVQFNNLYMFHLLINATQENASLLSDRIRGIAALHNKRSIQALPGAIADAKEAEANVVELRGRESICSDALGAILRSRNYASTSKECGNLSIVVKP